MLQSIIGKVIDNYEITGILGKGGMGVVYKAKDMTLDRDVALKMMDANFARDEEFLKRFKSEAKALAKLQNPNIVSVFALRETELGFALVMEYVEGGTLADLIRSHGAMPLGRALPVFRQLLTALDHAHRVGIIHRDIKPSNVMLAPDDVVKVTDFGLAKIQQVSSATVTMGTGGTLYYMSPEQIRGLANVDARGDIYSLGMTLYETVTGRVPFGNDATDFDIRQMIVDGRIPPPERFNQNLPREVVKAILKSIDKDPAKRFQSAAEMWDSLSKVDVGKLPSHFVARPIKPAPNLKKHTTPRRPLFVTVGVGMALLAGYVAFRLFTSTSPATLRIESQPAASKITLNGKAVGMTPLNPISLDPGVVTIRLDHAGYYQKDTVLSVHDGQDLTLTLSLTKLPEQNIAEHVTVPASVTEKKESGEFPKRELVANAKPKDNNAVGMGTLTLRVAPSGTISVDGGAKRIIGDEPTTMQVSAGNRSVLFENPKYGSKRITVAMKPGATKQLTCYFESYASISVSGGATWAMIVHNGQQTEQQAPIARFPLGPGKHSISVARSGFETQEGEKEITVSPSFEEKVVRLAFTLKKK